MSLADGFGLLSRERVRARATGRNIEGSQVWGLTQKVSQSQVLCCRRSHAAVSRAGGLQYLYSRGQQLGSSKGGAAKMKTDKDWQRDELLRRRYNLVGWALDGSQCYS